MTDPLVELESIESELVALDRRAATMSDVDFEAAMSALVERLQNVKQRGKHQSYGVRYASMIEEERDMITSRLVRRGAEQPETYSKTPFWGLENVESEEDDDEEWD